MASKNKFFKPAKSRKYMKDAVGAVIAPAAFTAIAFLNNNTVVQDQYTKHPDLAKYSGLGLFGLHVATKLFVENEIAREAMTGVGCYGAMIAEKALLKPASSAKLGLSGLNAASDGQVINATPKIDWANIAAGAGMNGYEDPSNGVMGLDKIM